jgi:hypothetical protein
VPSLFRRKPEVVTSLDPVVDPEPADSPRPSSKGYTPSKRELGKVTPKRRETAKRTVEPPPANRREAYRRMRDKERVERLEKREAMMAGDESALLARDRGPERALVRDIVDSRHTIGTWFFGGAIIVLVGSSVPQPQVRLASNLLWALLAIATVLDSVLLARQVRKLVPERFPDSQLSLRRLYLYAAMRGVTFRRMRVPRARIKIGTSP